ncbi:MAG: hypothetical protein ACE5FG_05285 [Myxococcota bacterium]
MSTILDALRKLQREREQEGRRDLESSVMEGLPLASSPRRRAPWLLGGAGVLVALAAAALMLRGGDDPEPSVPGARPRQAPVAVTSPRPSAAPSRRTRALLPRREAGPGASPLAAGRGSAPRKGQSGPPPASARGGSEVQTDPIIDRPGRSRPRLAPQPRFGEVSRAPVTPGPAAHSASASPPPTPRSRRGRELRRPEPPPAPARTERAEETGSTAGPEAEFVLEAAEATVASRPTGAHVVAQAARSSAPPVRPTEPNPFTKPEPLPGKPVTRVEPVATPEPAPPEKTVPRQVREGQRLRGPRLVTPSTEGTTTPLPAGFPALHLESVRWHPDPSRRVARLIVDRIRGFDVHEGDIVQGARIRQINPGSVELELVSGSGRVRLRIGR